MTIFKIAFLILNDFTPNWKENLISLDLKIGAWSLQIKKKRVGVIKIFKWFHRKWIVKIKIITAIQDRWIAI